MPETLIHLPALRQSAVEVAACPRAYVEIYINGRQQPESIPSERGSEVHHVMSKYVRHCATKSVASDWKYFDSLTRAAGPVAGPMLDGIRDHYEVDWKHVLDTEVEMTLDEDFEPTSRDNDESPAALEAKYTGRPPAYTGTLDAIFLSYDQTAATIRDYKTHPSVFDANTFQGKLYSLMLFQYMPALEVVQFELVFVRYVNCTRSVTYSRSDVPELKEAVSRARERQRLTHENPDAAKALPCSVCTYCPLAKDKSCPISEQNEYLTLTPQERLIRSEWHRRMRAIDMPVLRAYAEVEGPVSYTDGNGDVYEYGEQPVPSMRVRLDGTLLQVLHEYQAESGEDLLDGRLNVSLTKLKQLLDTKKREGLREVFESSVYEMSTKPSYRVRTADEGSVSEYESEDE